MTIALTEDHLALSEVVRSFLADRGALAAARALLDAPDEQMPEFWAELCQLGWTGLHVAEQYGGQGYGLEELAVVVEELGRAVAPGPFLGTVIASAVIGLAGTDAQRERHLPGLAAGTTIGAVALDGDRGLALGGALADLFLIRDGDDVVIVTAGEVDVTAVAGIDPTRRLGRVEIREQAGNDDVIVGGADVTLAIARTLAAAEAAGGADACVETAVEYVKVREQFGRPVGTFQAVKHHAADMKVDAELGAAVAWDAARAGAIGKEGSLVAALAASHALPAFRRCAETNIQLLGGIGYTWEHDAHLYLRRAATLVAVFGGDRAAPSDAFALARSGIVPDARISLPAEAERYRAEARQFRAEHDRLPEADRRRALIDSGYFMPHWPRPWGRGADAVEQVVLETELDGVEVPNLGIGGWVLLTLIQTGTEDQLARWIRPSLDGELRWCQLFSEPNAGSDAAAITTKAKRVDGGWLVNGQKVWTSGAQHCNRGLATVRTDPDAPKHAGVSAMVIDLGADGVEIRPLRELTGECLFNEVFFDDVFVPDDDVVGEINHGWAVARATLGNERVSIGGNQGSDYKITGADLVALAERYAAGDAGAAREVAVVYAEQYAMSALNRRHVSRAVAGGPPGPEGNIAKLLSAENAQRSAELAMRLAGTAAVTDVEARPQHAYLFSRCLTIAGGTSEIVRNLIAERILGLPRDPLLK